MRQDSPLPTTPRHGTRHPLTPRRGIYLQGARYVWNRTDMLAAAADPNVNYLMGNKHPTRWDLAGTRTCAGTEAVPNVSLPRSL